MIQDGKSDTTFPTVGVRVDGGRFEPVRPDSDKGWLLWSASVPVENLKEGNHEVVARAIDNANHMERQSPLRRNSMH